MNLDDLRAFVAVVQTGSFTAAARKLDRDKARLSRLVSGLERELGARLLERSTRALRLTEIGRSVYERSQGIVGASDDLQQFTRSLQSEPQGVLKLSCNVDFGLIAANAWIAGVLRRWPRMSVDVDYSTRRVDLIHEGFDLALRIGALDDSRLAARTLGEMHYGLFASPDYLVRTSVPRSPDDLGGHALLLFATSVGRADWALRPAGGGETVRIARAGRVRSGSITLLYETCLAGLGIARLPLPLAVRAPAGRLVPVLRDWKHLPATVSAVFPSNRFLAPKVRAFIDHVTEDLAARPELLAGPAAR